MYLSRVVRQFARVSSSCVGSNYNQFPSSSQASTRVYCSFTRICFKCESTLKPKKDDYFCPECNTVQPLYKDNVPNYFECFGLNLEYDLDRKDLQNKFLKLQALLHPDKFAMKSEIERNNSAEQASLLNQAYHTLRHPFKRALYLLQLNGFTIEEGAISQEQSFLMEMMERNEDVFECEDAKQLQKSLEKVEKELFEEESKIAGAFGDKDLDKARDIAVIMKYYFTLQQNIIRKGHELGVDFNEE